MGLVRPSTSYNNPYLQLEEWMIYADGLELERNALKRANEYNIQTIEYLRGELKKQRKQNKKVDLNPYKDI
jgi:hypothetical protein